MSEYVLRLIHAGPRPALATGNFENAAQLADAAVQDRIQYGNYLKWADVERFGGQGEAVFTAKLEKAKRFPSLEAALEFWKQQSATRPYRRDGMPNRPLTAFNVTVQKVA